MFQKLSRLTRHLFLFGLIVIAVTLTAIRILVLCVDLYKHELEYKLSKLFAAPVIIGQLSAKMHRLHPEIILKNISVLENNSEQVNLSLKELRFGIDLMEVILKRKIIGATWVSLIGAKLSVIRKQDGSFSIVGLKAGKGQPLWLLEGEHYQLLDSEINWLDKKRQGKNIRFKNIDLLIKNNTAENRHQIHFLSQLPTQYGKTLRISVDIRGNVFEPDNLKGEVYIAGKSIQFAELLTGALPLKLSLKKGHGDFEVWGKIQKSELKSLSGKVYAQNLSIQREDKTKLNFDLLKGQFNWLHEKDNWRLIVQDLKVDAHKTKWKAANFAIGFKDNAQLSANIKHIDLHLLSRLNYFFTPLFVKKHTWLNDLVLRGQLNNALVFADLTKENYTLKADFKKLTVKGLKDIPQFKNLSGSIQGNEAQGTLKLNSSNVRLSSKKMFRKSLKISQFKGDINWQQNCDDWTLSTDALQLDTAELSSQHKFIFKLPKDETPSFIDLQTAFYNAKDISKIKPYLPINTMTKDTISWLDRAFISGKVKRGDLSLYGNLIDFPFEKNQGVFQVLFNAQNVELAYAEGWQNFKNINAKVMFLNERLKVDIKTAKAGKIAITNTQVTIPSLEKSRYLHAKVTGNGRINDILTWLQKSPLDLPLKEVKEQISVRGRGNLAVNLKIPLTDVGIPKVTGHLKLKHAALTIRDIDLPVTRINGILKFDEQRFYTDKLHAFALGYPVRIKIKDNAKAMVINVSGKTGAKQLLQHFELPDLKFVKGISPYSLQLNLPTNVKHDPSLHIQSNLLGTSLALPNNLGKKSDEKKSLSVFLQLKEQSLLPISVLYNQNVKAKLKFNKRLKKLHSANILLGQGKLNFPREKGLNISINQASFSPLLWLPLINNDSKDKGHQGLLRQINIKTPKLTWNKKDLGALSLNLKRTKDNWTGSINSSFAKGKLKFFTQPDNSKYSLDMDYINLSTLENFSFPNKNKKTTQAKKLPLLEIQSQKLIWRDVNLGRLDLKSQRDGKDIYFNKMTVLGDQRELSLTGRWQLKNNQHYTKVEGTLKAEKFGEFLKKLDLNEDLKETSADITLALNWNAAPYEVSLAALNGNLNLNFDEGRISSIEPGFGRLLGVLAMGQWIKRLQLDFGDIYKEGLTFDSITGHYRLEKGNAYSDDLTVDAVPAKITLKGQLNLAAKTLNKEVSVIPKSSAALPIAGTIVGSIATVIAQTVTGEYEEGFYLRTKYKVQGKWSDLKVTPLHEQDGLLQKTLRGLTDFSWLNE